MSNGYQIERDHGLDAAAVLERAALAAAGPLQPLADGVDLERQLMDARAVVCVPGEANPVCSLLVRMSLLLAEDVGADPEIRNRYAALVAAQSNAPIAEG